MPIVVSGLSEVSRAFSRFDDNFTRRVGKKLRQAVEPVRAGSEVLAGQQVRNLGVGDPWTGTRTGGGVKVVYVAPRQRGRASKQDAKRRRPNLKPHLLRAMETALERNSGEVTRRVNSVLVDTVEEWGRG